MAPSLDAEPLLLLADEAARALVASVQALVAAAEAELDVAKRQLAKEHEALAQRECELELASEQLRAEQQEHAHLLELLQSEQARLTEEAVKLALDAEDTADAYSRLREERARFEATRSSWVADTVDFNVSGVQRVSVLQSTLLQCEDSMFSAWLSGRWPVKRDPEGSVFIDFSPRLFMPLVEYMQCRSIEDPENPTLPPAFQSPDDEAEFQRMLRYYGLFEWVFLPETVEHSVPLGDRCYAVLPPCPPHEESAGRDMQDLVLSLPVGWEVLCSESEGFAEDLPRLAARCWGAHTLCVQNGRGGFDSYRTAVRMVGGEPGSIFQAGIDWLESIDGGRRFRFRGLSGRLVIRCSRRPDQRGDGGGVVG